MNKKIFKGMSTAAIAAILSATMITPAFAKVDGYLVKDENGNYIQYSYDELVKESEDSLGGEKALLFEDYLKNNKNIVGYHDDVLNEYVNIENIRNAASDALGNNEPFDIHDFTKNAKPEEIVKGIDKAKVQQRTIGKDGTIVNKPLETPVEKVEVKEVSAINSTKVELTFAKDAKVTDADLKDKTIKLTAGDKTFTATYRVGSLADGKAAFDLAGTDALVDATTYTITSDSFGFASDKLVAKIADAYAKTFEKVTTDVVAKYNAAGEAQEAKVNIFLAAKNQYGEDIKIKDDGSNATNVKAVVKVNGMPLTDEVTIGRDAKLALNSFADGKAKLEITKTLKENDTIEITLTKFDKAVDAADAKEVASSKVSYTVKKGEAAVATTVASVNAKYKATTIEGHKNGEIATEVLPTESVTLTADVRDQYNNPISDADAGNKLVRWVVAEGKDLIDKVDVNNDLTSGTSDTQKNEISFKANKPGKLTIEAYNLVNGSKATYSITIGASKLTALTITDEKPAAMFNNEDVIYRKVAQDPEGANLTPEMIKFNVVAKTEGTTASDIAVTAKLRGGEVTATAKDIVISAKTVKAGTYEITPYVGTAFDAKDAVKGNKIVVTTTLNSVAQKIEAITVPTVKVGTAQKVDLVVKNKHGEVIPVQAKNVKTTVYKDGKEITADNIVTVGLVDKDGTVIADPANATTEVKKLSFNSTAKGDYLVRISIKDTAANMDVAVKAEESSLKSIELGSPISDNTLIAGTAADKSVVKPIEVKDDKGDVIIPDTAGWTAVAKETAEGADAGFASITYYKLNDKGEIVTAGVTKADAKGIAVKYDVHGLANDKDKVYTVTVSNGQAADKEIKDTVEVTVKAARAVKEINVTPASSTIAVGGKQLVTIKPVDQYGDFIKTATVANTLGMTIKSDNINIVTAATAFTPVDKDGKTVLFNDANVAGYTVELSGVKTGTAKVTVAKDAVTKAVDVTVAQASSVIDSVKIAGDKVDNDGKYKYVLGNNNDGNTTDNGETTQLSVKGFAGTSEVGVNAADVIWTMVSAKDSTGATIATVDANGLVTVTAVPKEDTTITIKADLYGKTATISIPVVKDYAAAANLNSASVKLKSAGVAQNVVTDLTKVDADATKEGIQLKIDGKTEDGEAANNTITLTFAGVDGFGETINVIGTGLSFNTDVVTVESDNNTLTATPTGAGSTTIRLTLADGTNFAYDVQVTDEIGAKVKKAAIDKALADVVKNDVGGDAAATRLTSLRTLSSVSSDLHVNTILNANSAAYNTALNNKAADITTVAKVQEVVNEVNAVAEFRNAADANAIKALLKTNTLGLNVDKYNVLVDADKDAVATEMNTNKAGFNAKTDVQTGLNNAINTVTAIGVTVGNTAETAKGAAVKTAVNATGTVTVNAVEITVSSTDNVSANGKQVTFAKGSTAGAAWAGDTLTVTLDQAKSDYAASDVNTLITNATGTSAANITVAFTVNLDASGITNATATLTNGAAAKEAVAEVGTTQVTHKADRAGNITVNVADGDLNKDVVVAVDKDDAPAVAAQKIVAALNADDAVKAKYTATQGTDANTDKVILTQKTAGTDVDLQVTLK